MKRSEMIKIMINAFENDYDDSKHISEANAKKVLSIMEKAGMLPPENRNRRVKDTWIDCIYCWEPENEN